MFTLYGALGSPYSMKMRAVLRYWRAPFVMKPAMGGSGPIAHVRPPVIPVVHTPQDEWLVDSTPMIELLDPILGAERSIIPQNPTLEFLSALFEDFADEWMTKVMFGYRWGNEQDARIFAAEGCYDILGSVGQETLDSYAELFYSRQTKRMNMVGCGPENMLLLQETLQDLVSCMGKQISRQRFLFGSRPSRADFALYGQLSQLCSDPTPSAEIRSISPLFHRWVVQCADLSDVEGTWQKEDFWSTGVLGLLKLCAEVYLPFLDANERAYRASDTVKIELRGRLFSQPPFRYQIKCLRKLKEDYARIRGSSEDLTELMQSSGVHRWLI